MRHREFGTRWLINARLEDLTPSMTPSRAYNTVSNRPAPALPQVQSKGSTHVALIKAGAIAQMFSEPVQRNVLILAICQALGSTGMSMLAAVASLVGYALVDDKSLATLPVAVQWTATMVTTIPASHLMRWIGRRAGLSVGALIQMSGGLVGCYAIVEASFGIFLLASVFIGIGTSFIQYYPLCRGGRGAGEFPRQSNLACTGRRYRRGGARRRIGEMVVRLVPALCLCGLLHRHGKSLHHRADRLARRAHSTPECATTCQQRSAIVGDCQATGVLRRGPGRCVELWLDGVGNDRNAAGNGCQWFRVHRFGYRDSVACARDVCTEFFYRFAHPTLRCFEQSFCVALC